MSCSGNCSSSSKIPIGVSITSKLNPEFESELWCDAEVTSTNHLKRTHIKQGYVDGLSNAKEASLQTGFDDGYPIGAQLGIRVGSILSKLALRGNIETFETAKRELNITNMLKKSYFDENLDLPEGEDHPILSKWEAILN